MRGYEGGNQAEAKGADGVAHVCRFLLHRIIQVVGLVLALAGFIIALIKFESLDLDVPEQRNHRALGITVMIFGLLQPLNALVRPHPPKEGEKKPPLRLGWEILHKGLGYLALILAVVTIFLGLKVGETFPPFSESKKWRNAYIGLLVVVIVIWVALLGNHFLRKKNQAKSADMSADGKAHLAPEDKVAVQP
jgi:protein-S-isoprenylcysteine O-methyltransferase Ste14